MRVFSLASSSAKIEFEVDDELTDAAIRALARLLLDSVEDEDGEQGDG